MTVSQLLQFVGSSLDSTSSFLSHSTLRGEIEAPTLKSDGKDWSCVLHSKFFSQLLLHHFFSLKKTFGINNEGKNYKKVLKNKKRGKVNISTPCTLFSLSLVGWTRLEQECIIMGGSPWISSALGSQTLIITQYSQLQFLWIATALFSAYNYSDSTFVFT